tara:strand:- start:441 stop:635 length:195 start_codon:yes stop_codon:yes gene_type:complete
METSTLIVLIMCSFGMVSSIHSILHFGVESKIKWWERLLMIIGGFSALLMGIAFTLMLLIEKFK